MDWTGTDERDRRPESSFPGPYAELLFEMRTVEIVRSAGFRPREKLPLRDDAPEAGSAVLLSRHQSAYAPVGRR